MAKGKPQWYRGGADSSKCTSATVRRQERAAGKLLATRGGRRRPGSGSNPLAKGDFVSQKELGECKQTEKKSISISRAMLSKLENEARCEGKTPVFHLEFLGPHPRGMEDLSSRWVMVPDWCFEELIRRQDGLE
jgi:hypothetical protein